MNHQQIRSGNKRRTFNLMGGDGGERDACRASETRDG